MTSLDAAVLKFKEQALKSNYIREELKNSMRIHAEKLEIERKERFTRILGYGA